MRGQDETEPAPKRQRLDNAGSSSESRPYAHPDSDPPCNEARNWFTGQGIQNRDGQFHVARDVNITTSYAPATRAQGGQDLVERRRALLETLQFSQMDARQMSIKQAHAKTCRWFLKDPEYLQWSKNDGVQSQGSFLWIKGKPGAGKSTLMKFLLKQTRRARSEGIIISFFFNARGEDMEKTTLGLYQSLLVQLLELRPGLQRVLDRFRHGQPQWRVELLQELFEEAVECLDETSLVCFIDALDECQEHEVRDMIRFLSELSDSGSQLSVCFASRHYPHITIPKGRSIVLEDRDEHHEDIAKYLDNALHIGGGKLSEQIRSELQEKASGVFMWVVLVVDILNKECDTGQKHTLRSRLRQIPSDLHALFRDILTRDTRNAPGLLLCIQWVLFAMRPLSPRELYYAVLAGVEPESLADCHTDDITNDDISRFILDKSKGLAESTKSKLPTIQFIHESVRDFLLKDNGLQAIWQGGGANLEGQSHDQLKRACFAYMTCEHVSHTIEALEPAEQPSKKKDQERRTEMDRRFPFLEYATRGVLYHADKAEDGKQSQADFLATFPLAGWVKRHNIFEKYHVRQLTPDVSFLYALAHENRGALISIQQEDRSCFQVEPERYGTPLFAALALKCVSAVKALMECQTKRQMTGSLIPNFDMPTFPEERWFTPFSRDFRLLGKQGIPSYLSRPESDKLLYLFYATEFVDVGLRDRQGRLPLSYVAAGKHVELAKSLLERGADINSTDHTSRGQETGKTVLHHAAESGTTEIVRLLIERGADVNACDLRGNKPLHAASQLGHTEIVELLIETGADIKSETGGETPLHLASHAGHTEVAKVLIERGADVNAADNTGWTPLIRAIANGHYEVAKLLIERGADVNAADNTGWTPLFSASSVRVAELLLENSANVKATSNNGSTPLSRAVVNDRYEVVKLLIERGADVNTTDKNGWTPLFQAFSVGVAKLLLEKGADAEATSNDGSTPLIQAVGYDSYEVVKLLIERGADVNAADNTGSTPLFSASSVRVAELLLENGANAKATSNNSSTPLSRAVANDRYKVVKLLIERGADVNTTDKNGWTPLFQAFSVGVAKLLLEKGADAEATSNDGSTPLRMAGAKSRYGVVELLKDWLRRKSSPGETIE